jgi:hypothetical protein
LIGGLYHRAPVSQTKQDTVKYALVRWHIGFNQYNVFDPSLRLL